TADRIELHDADRTARAEGNVRVAGRSAPAAGAKEAPRTSVSARTMRWTDGVRTAVFDGDVAARRAGQTARGDRGECRLDAAGRVERTVIEGDVTFEDRATGRRGSGTRAVDDPAAGVTNLAGEPAVAQDAQGNRVQGAVLTFRKESGSVEVKAKEGGRVESVYQTHGR
ncbi:MAG TPA: LptA/OstA family protein, partial [Thermoanaerobaculia bacterium]|nr:LptA/OstA family protein [Thermoanaerobaculia bacterium]